MNRSHTAIMAALAYACPRVKILASLLRQTQNAALNARAAAQALASRNLSPRVHDALNDLIATINAVYAKSLTACDETQALLPHLTKYDVEDPTR